MTKRIKWEISGTLFNSAQHTLWSCADLAVEKQVYTQTVEAARVQFEGVMDPVVRAISQELERPIDQWASVNLLRR